MRSKIYILSLALILPFLFTSCSKEIDEYNKPAIYWYSKIVQSVSDGELEMADGYYSSLQGEHIGSPLLPEATMILAIAHMQYEEYLLSEYFLDEYIKRYATDNEKEGAEFLKMKAKYNALPNPRRDQALIDEAIKEGEKFKLDYPESMYTEVVNSMLTRLYLAQFVLNEEIADLYDRLDKPKSSEYYRGVNPQPWIDSNEVDRAVAPWYRAWFEGDGTSSWYDFMVPDTKSVVSRNSTSKEDEENNAEEQPKPEEPKDKDSSSWYDVLNPFSGSDEAKEPEPEEQAEESKKEDSSSWYDMLNPFSKSDEVKEHDLEVQEQKENDNSSWYDFLNPFSNNTDLKKETTHEA